MAEYKRKLIEVALPLDAINRESAREKSIRHGHPSTLHLWWARRPLAACRAVLFASLVDDPSAHPDQFPTEEAQERERQRLFGIIEDLVKWENTTNDDVLRRAREEILKSTGGNPPPVLDPFCGGGSIPLEAQRLGLEAHGSDLNPVAVLITKALIEIPPTFAGRSPVNPTDRARAPGAGWRGAAGLAADVRYYGQWMRDEAERRIGHLYPKVELPPEQGGGQATVIAWLWARTVRCPNPACGAQMPLVRSFELSKKRGRQAWVEPIIDREAKAVSFEVRTGSGKAPSGTVSRRGATCLVCGDTTKLDYVRSEGMNGRMGEQMLAIVAEGKRQRLYITPASLDEPQLSDAEQALVDEARSTFLSQPTPQRLTGGTCYGYGLTSWGRLFTDRQLVALTTFSELVGEARERVLADAVAAGLPDDGIRLADGGVNAPAYADAVATYLAFGVDRLGNRASTICIWNTTGEKVEQTFGRQAIPMTWDFAEANPLGDSTGSWSGSLEWVPKVLERVPSIGIGEVKQLDAMSAQVGVVDPIVVTDPPYYDNIGYSDLSDFFYVWLRRMLRGEFPSIFSTVQTPKSQELIASPYRHDGDGRKAEAFFESGLEQVFRHLRDAGNNQFPLTLFYAFKQAETTATGVASTGWETMLDGLIRTGYAVLGTWPMRTERDQGLKSGTNVLASSIILVCRPRPENAPMATRSEFVRALQRELPSAIRTMQQESIAPVDLAQASIGPGMAVFSRYSKVLETNGEPMRVRTALELINQTLDQALTEQESEFDNDTRWAIAWFEQFGMKEGPYGDAETLSKAKDTSVQGMVRAGIVSSRAGKVRLLKRDEYPEGWDPALDDRVPIWELTQRLILAHDQGEEAAAALLNRIGSGPGEIARDLAYRLFVICERKGWAQEAIPYNSLVVAWPHITQLAADLRQTTRQARMDV